MSTFLRTLLIPCALLLSLTACGNNGVSELQEWMAEVKKTTHANIPKLTEPKVYVPVAYNGKASIDPFNADKLLIVLARLRAESNNGLAPDRDRAKEALEAFPLDSLKMVGTIENKSGKYALLQVDKTVFQAKVGGYLGQDFGRIMKITESEVSINERVQDATGDWMERESKLELQETKK